MSTGNIKDQLVTFEYFYTKEEQEKFEREYRELTKDELKLIVEDFFNGKLEFESNNIVRGIDGNTLQPSIGITLNGEKVRYSLELAQDVKEELEKVK